MIVDGYGLLFLFLNEVCGFMIFVGVIVIGLMLVKDDEWLWEVMMVF